MGGWEGGRGVDGKNCGGQFDQMIFSCVLWQFRNRLHARVGKNVHVIYHDI